MRHLKKNGACFGSPGFFGHNSSDLETFCLKETIVDMAYNFDQYTESYISLSIVPCNFLLFSK